MLGIDRHDLGPRRRPGRLHDRSPGDQGLLVGQRQPAAGLQRGQRHGRPAKPTTPLTTTSAVGRDLGQRLGPHQQLRPGWQAVRQLRGPARVGEGHPFGAKQFGLGGERVDRRAAPMATTRYRPGSARMTSMAWVPIDPVEPTRLTVFTGGSTPSLIG